MADSPISHNGEADENGRAPITSFLQTGSGLRYFQMKQSKKRFRQAISIGWGGRDRTSEWRNQNQFDYSTISKRIWKKGSKCPLAISIAWPPFPNKEAAVAGRISLAKSEATGCARADREGHGVDSTCEFDQHAVTRQRSPECDW
jgi:hypothetical protein